MPMIAKSVAQGEPTTVDAALQAALKLLKEKRLEVEYLGPLVDYQGEPLRFPAEIKDETRLNTLAGLFAKDPNAVVKDWKLNETTYVDMTAPLLDSVRSAGLVHVGTCFTIERLKAIELNELATAGDLEGIKHYMKTTLLMGWPA